VIETTSGGISMATNTRLASRSAGMAAAMTALMTRPRPRRCRRVPRAQTPAPSGPAALADLQRAFSHASRRCPDHDAMVVVRADRHQSRPRARDAPHEGGRHRRIRNTTRVSRRPRRSRPGVRDAPVSLRRLHRPRALHGREGERTRAARRPDCRQRLAVRRAADWRHPGGRQAESRARRRAAGRGSRARTGHPPR